MHLIEAHLRGRLPTRSLLKDSLALSFVAIVLAGCAEDPPPPAPAEPAPEAVASTCGEAGYLRARLSGALSAELDWPDTALRCESMRRPDDRGVRMRFAGNVGNERLTIIIAIPELGAGDTGAEFDSVVTITVDGSGRFFSTPNLGACWTDIEENSAIGRDDVRHIVAGSLTCVGPLGEFNGDAYVDVRDLTFSGIADWDAT